MRLYLKEMGTVSLLTREGEVEIAKRIEEGEKEVLHSLLEVPVTFEEIMDLTNRLEQERLAPQSGLDDFDEDDPLDLPTQKSRILKMVQRVPRPGGKDPAVPSSRGLAPQGRSPASQIEHKAAGFRRKMAGHFKRLRLERHHLEGGAQPAAAFAAACCGTASKRWRSALAAAGLNVTKFRNLKRSRRRERRPASPIRRPWRRSAWRSWKRSGARPASACARWNPRPAWPPAGC